MLTAGQNRLLGARARNAIELQHAVAAIGPAARRLRPRRRSRASGRRGGAAAAATNDGDTSGARQRRGTATTPATPAAATPAAAAPRLRRRAPAGGGRGGANPNLGDFQTVQRLDNMIRAADHRGRGVLRVRLQRRGAELRRHQGEGGRAGSAAARPALGSVSITIKVDADYDVVQTRLTRNVVGIIPGTDPKLKDTYVMFGAHYDHVGYQQTPPGQGAAASPARRRRRRRPAGASASRATRPSPAT